MNKKVIKNKLATVCAAICIAMPIYSFADVPSSLIDKCKSIVSANEKDFDAPGGASKAADVTECVVNNVCGLMSDKDMSELKMDRQTCANRLAVRDYLSNYALSLSQQPQGGLGGNLNLPPLIPPTNYGQNFNQNYALPMNNNTYGNNNGTTFQNNVVPVNPIGKNPGTHLGTNSGANSGTNGKSTKEKDIRWF